ncbi:heterokaryon incompatibility, partial [Periconia macrospinosa]
YQAVSYAWGEPTQDQPMKLNGQYTLPITKTLASALSRLTGMCSTGYLWIDQICIDQSNLQERSQQVSLMGEIYQSALEVLVWTGQEVNELSETFKKSAQISARVERDLSRIGKDTLDKKHVRKITELLCRPWFSRGWVIQEAVMGKKVLL